MKGKNYDYKEAYNKNLTAKARLHYLENARNDQDSPNNMCSPAHYGDSPLNQFGSLASIASGFANQQQQQSTGTTGGALSNAMAGVMNTGQPPSATSTTSGALAGSTPNAGMLSGVDTQGSGDVENRITALEQNAPSNTLGNAKPVFNPQAQQAAQGIYGSVNQRQSALCQRTYTPDNDEPTTYDDRLNFKGETQSQIINKADTSNSDERSEFVRDSIKGANKKIDKAIYNLKNPKMKITQTFGKIKKI
jgi:hypothetical protein